MGPAVLARPRGGPDYGEAGDAMKKTREEKGIQKQITNRGEGKETTGQ